MNVTSLRRAAAPAAAVVLSLSLAACGSSSSGSSSTINGAGSTAQQSAQQAWAAGFKSTDSSVTVNYNPIGSGGGVTNFNSGAVVFAGSDAALDPTKGEVAAANKRCGGSVIEVPDYISAIAVAYNVPGVTKLNLDAETIAKIFSNKITKWNDQAIKAINPGVNLPALTIAPIHRSDKSGTTNNFTSYLNKAAGSVWTDAANSVWPSNFTGSAANGTSGVVSSLKASQGGIAYVDDSQAGGLQKASIKVGSGYIQPSAAGAAQDVAVSTQQAGRAATDYALDVARTSTEPNAYPITLVSYLIACPTYKSSDNPAAISKFLTYVVSSTGQQTAAQLAGSAPLPSSIATKAAAWFSAIKAKG